VGGVRIPPDGPILPPTPPPDIDLEAWPKSLDLIAAWRPERIAVTHFGVWDDPEHQLERMREELARLSQLARELDSDAYAESVRAHVRAHTDAHTAAAYEQAMPPDHLFAGLERALRRVP
jgi:hypothetical protein